MCSLSERHWGGKSYQMKAWFKGNLINSNTQQLKGVGVPSCVQLCDSRDRSPPSTSVHGTLQARILDWAAISSTRGSSWPRDWTQVSRVSCIGRQIFFFFYCWDTWEAHDNWISPTDQRTEQTESESTGGLCTSGGNSNVADGARFHTWEKVVK